MLPALTPDADVRFAAPAEAQRRHPLGAAAVLMALIATVVTAVSVYLLGQAVTQTQALFGRAVGELPWEQLPSSLVVYIVVAGVGIVFIALALGLGIASLVKLGCKWCGAITIAMAVLIAPIAWAVYQWGAATAMA